MTFGPVGTGVSRGIIVGMSTPLIVVGIDDSDGARAALAWAAGQATATGSRCASSMRTS